MAAAAVPHAWQFPFTGGVVSKDGIPPVDGVPSFVQGCSNLPAPSPLHFCCWIEGMCHTLMRDPYIRCFVADFALKVDIAGTGSYGSFASTFGEGVHAARYEDGFLVMKLLALRHVLSHTRSNRNNAHVETFMIRTGFRQHLRDRSVADERVPGQGDCGNLLQLALCGIRLFIAVNWPGNAFQQQFMAYGGRLLCATIEKCPGAVGCPLGGREKTSYDEKSTMLQPDASAPGANLVDMTDGGIWHLSIEDAGKYELQECVRAGAGFATGKWRPGRLCECKQFRLQREVLLLLPWVLYISTARRPGISSDEQYSLSYDPNELVLGPTADGQFAKYRMIACVHHNGATGESGHYIADVRTDAGEWNSWSFDRATVVDAAEKGRRDKTSIFMAWERVE